MIKIAVVGYGRVGTAHAACYARLPEVMISAVADLAAPRRRAATADHPGAQIVSSFDEISEPIDLVLICTPPASHESLIDAALCRGVHVFCEKPVFLDPDEGERLVALAATTGRIIYPGHNYTFAPMLRRLRDYVQNGALGTVQHVSIQIDRTGPAAGTDDWQPAWRTDPQHSVGGVLTDHGPHCIYLTEWLSGQRIRSATSTTDAVAPGVDHHAQLALSLTGDVTASVTMSWRAPTRRSIYRILGSLGEACLENDQLYTPGGGQPVRGVHETPATTHAHDDWMPALARDVLDSLQTPHRLYPLTDPAITIAGVIIVPQGHSALRVSAGHGGDHQHGFVAYPSAASPD